MLAKLSIGVESCGGEPMAFRLGEMREILSHNANHQVELTVFPRVKHTPFPPKIRVCVLSRGTVTEALCFDSCSTVLQLWYYYSGSWWSR